MPDLLKLKKELDKSIKKRYRVQCQYCGKILTKQSMVRHFYFCKSVPQHLKEI